MGDLAVSIGTSFQLFAKDQDETKQTKEGKREWDFKSKQRRTWCSSHFPKHNKSIYSKKILINRGLVEALCISNASWE